VDGEASLRPEEVRIRNFKSLRDVSLMLGGLNVVVGPNASGKSNLVDFFRFLRRAMRPAVPYAPYLDWWTHRDLVWGEGGSP